MARKDRAVDHDRDYHAARLRAEGWRYHRIAAEMGYDTEGGAYKAVQRGLKRAIAEPMAEARHLQLAALDELARTAWEVLHRDHVVVSAGKVVELNGEPLRDDGPVLAAIDRLLRIGERQAKLLGIDAPAEGKVDSARVREVVDHLVAIVEGEIKPVPLQVVTELPDSRA